MSPLVARSVLECVIEGSGAAGPSWRRAPARRPDAAGQGPGERAMARLPPAPALARVIEPIGQNVLQHGADFDSFTKRSGLEPMAAALSARLKRPAAPRPLPSSTAIQADREPAELGDHFVEPQPLDVLHRVKADIPILAHLEDRHDVGMMKPCRGQRFAAEPLLGQPVSGDLTRQDLRATRRPSEICSASYTTPMPPRPTSRRIR